MSDVSEDILRQSTEQPVQKVRDGWRCPVCHAVMAPDVHSCVRCVPCLGVTLVPRHVLTAVMQDLVRAKDSQVPGQRIVRGTFVLHHVEQLVNAVIREKSK